MKKIIIGALVGGLVMFIASFIIHVVLPIGEMGIKSLPNEDAVIAAMKQNITEHGIYFFPGMGMTGEMTKEQEQAWQAKYEAGPTGVLIYHPSGSTVYAPSQLLTELASDIVAVFLALLIVAPLGGTYLKRVMITTLFGVIAWLAISISYWNWYGSPFAYIFAEGLDQVLGWACAGLVIAKIVKPKSV
jgi:hypothetical protein